MENKSLNYNDKQRYDNGYNRQSDKQFSNGYQDISKSSRDNRSPSWSRTTQSRYQLPRSQSANNEYELTELGAIVLLLTEIDKDVLICIIEKIEIDLNQEIDSQIFIK